MKSFLTTCFVVCVASTIAMVSATKCVEQEECEEGQCCSGVPPFGGICRNMTIEGGKCHLVDKTVPIFGDFIIGPCPCSEGLECVQQGKKKNNGICQVPPTTPAPTVAEDTTAEEPVSDDNSASVASDDDTPAEEPAGEADDTSASDAAADDTPAEEPAAVADDTPAAEAAADAE